MEINGGLEVVLVEIREPCVNDHKGGKTDHDQPS